MHRGRLVIAGAGALVSGVVIASAIAMAGPGKPASDGSATPTLAAGAATGPAMQASGLGAAGPASSRTPSDTGADRPAGTQLSTPPPLVDTTGSKNQVMITTATQPLAPDQAPGARPNGGGSAAGGTAAVPGTLQLSAGGVILGERQHRADHPHRGGRDGQLVGQREPAGPGQPEQLRKHAAERAEHHADGAGQPGRQRGQRGHHLPGARLGHAGNPGHLVGAAGWFRLLVAPSSPSPPGPSPSSGTMSSSPPADPSSLGPASWHRARPGATTRPARGPGGPKLER